MPIRTTEQIAPETLAKYIGDLNRLTADQPTTAELEEALSQILPCISHVLRSWISARHLIGANALAAAAFRDRHPEVAAQMEALRHIAATPFIPTETAEEAEALDAVESKGVLHPVFLPLTRAMNGGVA